MCNLVRIFSTLESTALSGISHFGTPVTGRRDCRSNGLHHQNSKEWYWGRNKRGRGQRRDSCAIVTRWFNRGATIAQLLRDYCAIVAVSKTLKNKGKCLATSSLWELLRCLAWTIAPPFANYCVSSPFTTPTPIPLQSNIFLELILNLKMLLEAVVWLACWKALKSQMPRVLCEPPMEIL